MSRLALLALVVVSVTAVPASAAMTVGTFVGRANALREQGFAALLSPDFQVLKEEARQARRELQTENATRVRAGQRPIACVPDGETIAIEDMIDGLAALPAPIQRQPLKAGYAQVLAQRFPCGR